MKKTAKAPSEKAAQALLEKHACPVPFHEVRTRFLGNIATPEMSASPLRIIKDLWGGELPVFDSMDDLNELLDALVQGLWNELTVSVTSGASCGCALRGGDLPPDLRGARADGLG